MNWWDCDPGALPLAIAFHAFSVRNPPAGGAAKLIRAMDQFHYKERDALGLTYISDGDDWAVSKTAWDRLPS